MELREPPAKKRKSRFGPQPTLDKPFSTNIDVANDLQRRQAQALAIAAKLSQDLGLNDLPSNNNNNMIPPNESSFFQTASMFQNVGRSGLGFSKIYEERVYIPKDDYPNINFIGLILGPKGLNQKRMQAETGCRILVKGKGSSKNGIPDNDPEEPLHVYISADSMEKVQRGVNKIKELLTESTDKYNEGGMEVKEHRHNGYIDVEIPNSQIGVVIGKQGNNIQRIQDVTGATVMISPRNVPNNPLMKMITISGTPQQCESALQEVHKTIQELKAFRARLKQQQAISDKYAKAQHHQSQLHSHSHSHTHSSLNNSSNDLLSDNNHHRDYGTASYDPSFQYPDAQYDDDLLPKIHSGAVESGFCEIIIPNSVVGLIIGKNASNVKAMKDRTRCDIRVQKDEETLPDSDTRLVALRGCVQSIKAARQEIAKVIHMANAQKQGATLASLGTTNPYMMYQNPMMYQQMMYQQMGYGQQYQQQYQQWQQQQQQQQTQNPNAQSMDPQQMQQAYMQQWQQYQQQLQAQNQNVPTTATPGADTNDKDKKDDNPPNTNNSTNNDNTDNKTKGSDQYDPNAASAPNTSNNATITTQSNEQNDKNDNNDDKNQSAAASSAAATATTSTLTPEQKQYQQQMQTQQNQMMQSYGWTPQQMSAYQQQQAYYQQYYAQYAKQYPQQYAQYAAAMQQQMLQQQPPPPPPPPDDNDDNTDIKK